MSIVKFVCLCLIFLASCKHAGGEFEKKQTRYYLDDASFHKMKCGLYINIVGKIAYSDFDKPLCDSCLWGFGYISEACYAIRFKNCDGQCEYKALKTLVDTNSLIFLNDLYFKDRSNVFYFNDMEEGGMLYRVVKAHPSSFKIFAKFSQQYGYDGYNYFSGNEILSHAEVRQLGLDTQKLK